MTPLIEIPPEDLHPKVLAEIARHYGITEQKARDWIMKTSADTRYFINEIYRVETQPVGTGGLRITIQRLDGEMIRDWRHFQTIKNELAGEEREAVELYPAESRKVDTSNRWHLWVLPPGAKFDFGWPQRDVRYAASDTPGLQQRAL
jgi:hypothetical protein